MSHADRSVSFILLHRSPGTSLSNRLEELRQEVMCPGDATFAYDLTQSKPTETLNVPAGVTPIHADQIGSEIIRRLEFFVHPDLLPVCFAPLLVRALWEQSTHEKAEGAGTVLAYEGVGMERLLTARRMLMAGSEAVLIRNDGQESIVLALAVNGRNRRLVQHWADCVSEFCTTAHPQHAELEQSLGSSMAAYLCDTVTTLQGLDDLQGLGALKKAQRSNNHCTFYSDHRGLLRLAVRKLLPSLQSLQANPAGSLVTALNLATPEVEQQPGLLITNLMYVIWSERQDLRSAFDLNAQEGRRAFVEWYLTRAPIEFELGEEFIRPIREAQNPSPPPERTLNPLLRSRLKSSNPSRGLNLVGYPRAEMGMGEQLRSCADSLAAVDIPFAINDFNAGIIASHADRRYEELLQSGNPYPVNLFHINADQLPLARERLGAAFLRDHYNIGYWEWELSRFPEAWLGSIDMVDEIWAPSTFIYKAIASQTQKPVVWMPLAVEFELPSRQQSRSELRSQFKLPETAYLFLFSFDFSSFSTRKNYRACLKAFRLAFNGNEDVGLVLKTIRHPHHKHEFWEMLREVGDDPRVHVIDTVLRKPAVRTLMDVCDCFVSLHRSEGFGLSIAEAMYLGKPVIATNYSGNVDFTRKENAFLVDYELVPVKEGEYVHPEGQVWADPDTEQAAGYMQRVYRNPSEGRRVGQTASDSLKRENSFKVVGQRYANRVTQILAAKSALAAPAAPQEGRMAESGSMQRAAQMIRKFW